MPIVVKHGPGPGTVGGAAYHTGSLMGRREAQDRAKQEMKDRMHLQLQREREARAERQSMVGRAYQSRQAMMNEMWQRQRQKDQNEAVVGRMDKGAELDEAAAKRAHERRRGLMGEEARLRAERDADLAGKDREARDAEHKRDMVRDRARSMDIAKRDLYLGAMARVEAVEKNVGEALSFMDENKFHPDAAPTLNKLRAFAHKIFEDEGDLRTKRPGLYLKRLEQFSNEFRKSRLPSRVAKTPTFHDKVMSGEIPVLNSDRKMNLDAKGRPTLAGAKYIALPTGSGGWKIEEIGKDAPDVSGLGDIDMGAIEESAKESLMARRAATTKPPGAPGEGASPAEKAAYEQKMEAYKQKLMDDLDPKELARETFRMQVQEAKKRKHLAALNKLAKAGFTEKQWAWAQDVLKRTKHLQQHQIQMMPPKDQQAMMLAKKILILAGS